MTIEDKFLLMKDLCGRIPYHPKGLVVNACTGAECEEWLTCATFDMFTSITNNCRLYLRPMSSMTEEEIAAYLNACDNEMENALAQPRYSGIDWLLSNHFDFRGLIEKGLAIEVTEENNPY